MELNAVLKNVDAVRVAVHEVPQIAGEQDAFDSLPELLAIAGWETMVKVNDNSEHVLVMNKINGNNLSGLAVVVRDGSDLVVVEVYGQLERIIQWALEEHFTQGLLMDIHRDLKIL